MDQRNEDHSPPPLLHSNSNGSAHRPGETKRGGPVSPIVHTIPTGEKQPLLFKRLISAKYLDARLRNLHSATNGTNPKHRHCTSEVNNNRSKREGHSATYDPLCSTPDGMAKYDAAHAQAIVNTGTELERAERSRTRLYVSHNPIDPHRPVGASSALMPFGSCRQPSPSPSQCARVLMLERCAPAPGGPHAARAARGNSANSREEVNSTGPTWRDSRPQGPTLHHKELTQVFYGNYQGGVLAHEAYLHYMADVNRKRGGTKNVCVRQYQRKQQQKEELRCSGSTHLDDSDTVNYWSRGGRLL